MKNLYFIVLLIGLAITSCTSFIDEVNYSSQGAEAYYATKDGYESLVTGCYASLKSVYNSTNYYSLAHLGTDLGTFNRTDNPNVLNSYTVQYNSGNGTVSGLWTSLFNGLKNFNAAIGRSGSVITTGRDALSPDVLAQRVAEVKALRALYLFEIIRNWGQAPLITTEYMAPVTAHQYNSEQEFYDQILSDLSEANLNLLPWRQTGAAYGRVSRATAKHLRALVYLTRGYLSFGTPQDFTNAFNDATDVFNSSGHELLDDYMMVHRHANQRNNEILFNIGFANAANYNNNNWHMYYLFPYREGFQGLGQSVIYSNDWATVMPTKQAYMQFDWLKDRRASVTFMSPLNADPVASTDGTNRGQNFFAATNAVAGSFAVGDTCLYFPVPTDAKYKFWIQVEKDAQLAKAHPYKIFNYPTGNPGDMSPDTDGNDYFKMGYQSSNGTTRAWNPVWKFKDANVQWSSGNTGTGTRNIYIFRLAETCLIAAEAAVKLNDNPNALLWINKVRNRAANNAPEAGLPDFTGTVTLNNILDERGRELLGEVPRWNDLQRTGLLVERVLQYNWDVRNVGTTLLTQDTYNSKFKLRPIPLSWLNSLSNEQELGNNPGW
ncbi:MAG: RagB/SusD family nutrient uptake outer membrane protein [Dysgonamonadaceae bacterium]|nr:RagB/SusD family nutrient uptake outer membrane protein [Dysgonamonadaceae bacterium]